MRKRRKHKDGLAVIAVVCASVIAALSAAVWYTRQGAPEAVSQNGGGSVSLTLPSGVTESSYTDVFEGYAASRGISVKEYPESIREMYLKNPETENFALQYPFKKGSVIECDLSQYSDSASVPLLMQWDERWGYAIYGGDVLGLTGCGPTCLSMVAFYLLGDVSLTPYYVAEYSTENGYCLPGNGTSWSLMSDGARSLGLKAKELPLNKNLMVNSLNSGNPLICIMGPGDFTDSGHYIVLAGVKDGKFVVNDPNSRQRSGRLWSYEEINTQIRNIWSYSV